MTDTHAQFLLRAFENDKLSHAYLFSGNDRERKHAVITEILPRFGCVAADLHEIKANGEITIAQIRELGRKLSFSPWASHLKAAVVYDADRMNYEAQGAFLKLLEEPAGDTAFFLISEYPFALLDTIRSRVQELRFWRFDKPDSTNRTDKSYQSDLQKLMGASLSQRLEYAKSLADDETDVIPMLEEWLRFLRNLMLQKRVFPLVPKRVQETLILLKTTNVNKRLAIERVLLIV